MWTWWILSCAYVSQDELLAHWDVDGDGWPVGEDCAPDDPEVYPGAPDRRGDGCDTDCGVEPDGDGDDWPAAADCDDTDPQVFPCSPHERPKDGRDQDCDGLDEVRASTCPGLDPDYPPDRRAPACSAAEGASGPGDGTGGSTMGGGGGGGPPTDPTTTGGEYSAAGHWIGTCVPPDGWIDADMELEDDQGSLSGTVYVDAELPQGSVHAPWDLEGVRVGPEVELVLQGLDWLPFTGAVLELVLEGDTLTGQAVPDGVGPVDCTFTR